MSKKRIIKDYKNLPAETIAQVKITYPNGFSQHLITYFDRDGNKVSALPFETSEIYYLIRMTISQAEKIISADEDYDEDGNLRDDFEINEIISQEHIEENHPTVVLAEEE